MIDQNASATFTPDIDEDGASGRGTKWCTLEQVFKADDENEYASLGTLYNFLPPAYLGQSAVSSLAQGCGYAKSNDTSVTITLDFWVFPSQMDLPYSLSTTQGGVSNGGSVRVPKSFDLLVDGREYVEMPYIFEGSLSRQMPVFNADGTYNTTYSTTLEESLIIFSEKIHTVLRANGSARGYRHTLTAYFDKTNLLGGKSKIEDPVLNITCTWVNERGEYESTTLKLDVPQCAQDLLEFCEDGSPIGTTVCVNGCGVDGEEKTSATVYYSVCDEDSILKVVRNDK